MVKSKRSKQDEHMVQIVGDAITEVMIPALEAMEDRLKSELASKEDLREMEQRLRKDLATKEQFYDVVVRLDSIEDKLNKVVKRQDVQEDEIFDIKKSLAFN